jgi:hypothetical protein
MTPRFIAQILKAKAFNGDRFREKRLLVKEIDSGSRQIK